MTRYFREEGFFDKRSTYSITITRQQGAPLYKKSGSLPLAEAQAFYSRRVAYLRKQGYLGVEAYDDFIELTHPNLGWVRISIHKEV